MAKRFWLIAYCLLPLLGCGSGGGGLEVEAESGQSSELALRRATPETLTSYLGTALRNDVRYFATTAILPPTPVPPGVTDATTETFSTTTLQEMGVDEADRVKTDGHVIYSIGPGSPDTIRRHLIPTSGTELTLAEEYAPAFSEGATLQGLYLDSTRNQLVALAWPDSLSRRWWFWPSRWRNRSTEVMVLDVSDAVSSRPRYKLRLEGGLVSSRRIDSTLYLVLRSYPNIPDFDYSWRTRTEEKNLALLAAADAATLLPTVGVDNQAAVPLVRPEDCYLQVGNAYPTADVITTVAIDLASGAPHWSSRCFVGSTEALYVSQRNLYLATTRYSYERTSLTADYVSNVFTDVHKFALNGLDIEYRGSGRVDGHLGYAQDRKSFRFGERDGHLLVITSTPTSQVTAPPGDPSATAASPALLTVLKEGIGSSGLNVVATLPNERRPAPLGKPNELIYATRFLGNRGYLVTYRKVDPLYVLDLSDPTDPRVAGELEVLGYSDYLFPVTADLLLGVGKDAIDAGTAGDGRFAWYQGVKLSVVDVSQISTPREVARHVIGRRGTDATVLHDHHGIAFQNVEGVLRVAMPVNLHDMPPAVPTGAPNDYFGYTHTGLYRFEIDTGTGALTARDPVVAPGITHSPTSITNDRSVLVGNQVHYLRGSTFISSSW